MKVVILLILGLGATLSEPSKEEKVEYNVQTISEQEMNSRLLQAFYNLKNHGTSSLVSEAKKVIEFSVELTLKHFPKQSQDAGTFLQVVSGILQQGFVEVNDDALVKFRVDDFVLDDIENILHEQKGSMVEDLVHAIASQDVFLKQVMTSLEYGLMENYYIDNYGDE
eukprot:TRINITY_DN3217_c0_g4_i1.p3 TRINITY_DN3217_c0_g4~~TRINITY_DN3217_c0_g4_i1.p3  ORF type:complete len:167 (-),score=23.13 TRINITY_DN3217_c0_g4_i1:841-1341(-)